MQPQAIESYGGGLDGRDGRGERPSTKEIDGRRERLVRSRVLEAVRKDPRGTDEAQVTRTASESRVLKTRRLG